jgi:hypothetical protein
MKASPGNARALPVLSQFPGGKDVYRIDWFGPVDFPSRSTRGAQIAVEVRLSLVSHPERIHEPDWTSSAGFSSLKFAYVSIGQLVFLRVGDLWRDGSPFGLPDYEREDFRDVEITTSTVSYEKAGAKIGDDHLLPFSEHRFHKHYTRSNCVVVEIGQQRRIVVPALELIRFYFGSSSKLLGALFSAGLEQETLFTFAQKTGGHAEIVLSGGMPRVSVHDIARLAFCGTAWGAAQLTNHTLAKRDPDQSAVFPYARFPFFGKTTLSARGMWLNRTSRSGASFVVFSLESCTHPFPYRNLRFSIAGEDAGSQHDGADVAESPRNEELTATLVEEDANPALSARDFFVRSGFRFPDLRNKPAQHVPPEVELPTAPNVRGPGSPADRLAVGPAIGKGDVRPADLILAPEELAPEFVRSLLPLLDSFPGHFELMTGGGADGWSIPLRKSLDAEGHSRQTCSRVPALQRYR